MKNTLSGRLNNTIIFTNLVLADIKKIFRDKTLLFMVFVPFLFIALLRYGLPFLNELLPVLEDYNRIIFSFFCVLTAVFPSFIIGMILMDERDEGVLTVLRVAPLNTSTFILYRMAFVYIFSFFFSILFFSFSGILTVDPVKVFMAGFLISLISPITTLAVISLASNKIEAVTIFKGLNLILSLPMLAVIFDFRLEQLFGIIPVYWTYQYISEIEIGFSVFKWVLPGVFIHLVYILFFYRRFKKRMF